MQVLQTLSNCLTYPQAEDSKKIKQLLSEGLYSLDPVCANLSKANIRLLSVPGVAQVCLKLKKDPSLTSSLTIRSRSIAIVSRGLFMDCSPRHFLPLMDWYVAQLKFYANLDCYPFVIRPSANLKAVLEDLSNTYAGALFLDDECIPNLDTNLNFFVLQHWDVCEIAHAQITDAQHSASILARALIQSYSGQIDHAHIQKWLKEGSATLPLLQDTTHEFRAENQGRMTPIEAHQALNGKITVNLNFEDIAQIKKEFTYKNISKFLSSSQVHECVCSKLNAIVTDGSAVLGLGNMGPIVAVPVMQAKCMMFKHLGDVQMLPVCINPRNTPAETVQAILDLVYMFRAINLQDIKAPECFTIQRSLHNMDIMPVFHDDQHGTAIAILAGFINALSLVNKKYTECKVVINGAGAAGLSTAKLLHKYGVNFITVCDTFGAIYMGRQQNMNEFKQQIAHITNENKIKGKLEDVIEGADVFIGVSCKGAFHKEWVKKMAQKPIIFGLANPDPQISRQDAMSEGCFIYGSGRSGQPNQITNSLAYPGIFKAINTHKIPRITCQMKLKAAQVIANSCNNLSNQQILPNCLDKEVSRSICERLAFPIMKYHKYSTQYIMI